MEARQYNKLIIFDLDGVLIDSREMHFEALNRAISTVAGDEYVITKEEHLSTYDGLPTRKKLELLTKNKNLPEKHHTLIAYTKQEKTKGLLRKLSPDKKLQEIFQYLKSDCGYKICVATNAVSETAEIAIRHLGLDDYVDFVISAEQVLKPKPYPEMYWSLMTYCNAIPSTTIIVEDSHVGRQGAIDSGATLLAVEDPDDMTFDKVKRVVDEKELGHKIKSVPWRDSKLNILIPMAGAGSRFQKQGFTFPKPLIDVHGKPMIQLVVENLNIEANYIFIVQKVHYDRYQLKFLLNLIVPNCKIVIIDGLTEGAACTTLAAKEYIDNDHPLLMVNSDQLLDWNSNEVMYSLSADNIDGGIITFASTHPKYSYVAIGEDGFITEVVEKKVISNHATVGFYYWTHGADYVKYAEKMISDDSKRVNDEFYVAPVYQEAIVDGKKIKNKVVDAMHSLGTPEDLSYYLSEHKGNI